MSLGITEIVLILIVVIVIFGGKKIPELARGLGRAQAEYKKAKETIESEVNDFKQEISKVAAAEEHKQKTETKAKQSTTDKTSKTTRKKATKGKSATKTKAQK